MTGPEESESNLVAIMLPAAEPWAQGCIDLCVTVNSPLVTVITMAPDATARRYAGVEAPRSRCGLKVHPLTSIQLKSCGENIRVLLNLLQSNTAWLSRGSVIQHSRSGRRSPWTPSASSWGAPPYVPSTVPRAAGTEFTHSRFIIYLFVYLFITQARWLRLSPHRKRV